MTEGPVNGTSASRGYGWLFMLELQYCQHKYRWTVSSTAEKHRGLFAATTARNYFVPLPTGIGTVEVWNGDKESEGLLNDAMKTEIIPRRVCPTAVLHWTGSAFCITMMEKPLICSVYPISIRGYGISNTAELLPQETHSQSSQSRWGFAYFYSTLDNVQYWNDDALTQKYW